MEESSRRRFLRTIGGWAALAASLGEHEVTTEATGLAAQGSDTIRSVEAYPVYINERSDDLLDPPTFSADDDPRRWTYGGPFSQLPSAIIAIIKTDAGLTGFGMGAGGSAAVEIISGHLRHLLVGTNPLRVERLWDQMYTAALFYGRRGIFAMALSAVDNALWDIAGKHAGRPVHELVGGTARDRIAVYQTGGQRRGRQSARYSELQDPSAGGAADVRARARPGSAAGARSGCSTRAPPSVQTAAS